MNPILAVIVVFVATIVLGMPFTWSLMISSIVGCAFMGGIPLSFFAQRMFTGAERYTLLAIFFFMLAGALMQYGGISRRLINFSKALVGFMPGGLSIVVILTCVFFSAISGSSIATTAAIGGMLYPELVKAGYPEDYAAALPVVGGTLGIVIPPSIVFIVYGTAVNASVSKLLLSGVIPGLLGGLGLCVYAYIVAKKRHFASVNKFSWKEVWINLKSSLFALLMPVVILGGIYAGVFTPTESAAVAVVYGFIISAFVYKELSWKQLKMIVIESVKNTANILLLIMAANVFGWVLTANNVASLFGDFINAFIHNKYVFLLFLNILLLILGMLMDNGAIILIVAPLVYPIALKYGIDPIHLGCIMVFNVAVGQATPPFGNCLFASTVVTKRDIMQVSKAALPGIVILFAAVFLVTYIPALAMALPNMMK